MSVQTSLEELHQVIKNHNPFYGRSVVQSQQVWGEEFPDIPSLNSHASDFILETIDKVNRSNLSTFGITLLAQKGVGKSHILSRIRHHLQTKGGGLFIYMCEYGNLTYIKSQFLQALASSLRKRGNQGVMQCQEVATALVNKAFDKNFTPQQLVGHFHKGMAKNPQIVTQLTNKVLQLKSDNDDPHIVRAIIWSLSSAHAPFAISWLSGRELTQAQADVLGLPNSSQEDRDERAFRTACQILELASFHATPVICFDELDGAEYGDEDEPTISGYSRAQIVASLGKDLYNNLKRGVIVTSMYESTWRNQIKALSGAEAVEDRIAQKIIEINLLRSDDALNLVAGWLEDFYARQGLTPPHKLYPFNEKQLREIGNGATIREILRWCSDNFGTVIDPLEQIESLYQELEADEEDLLDDNVKIANAIAFGLHYLGSIPLLKNIVIWQAAH